MKTLPLFVIFLTVVFECFSKKSYKLIPHFAVEDGHIIFYAAYGKNITFKTSSAAGVSINDVDILTTLNRAHNATSLVKYYQQTFATYVDRIDSLEQRVSTVQIQTNNNSEIELLSKRINIQRILTRRVQASVRRVENNLLENECSSDPCKNGGNCVDRYLSYTCHCPDGWEGTNCEEDVDECSRFDGTDLGCQNGATCVNKPGTYECRCQPGFVGLHCTRGKLDCSIGGKELCDHGVCVQHSDGYKCICDQGWTTDGKSQACTVDVDECNLNHPACSKSPSVPCINVPGSFYCGGCPAGYTGNGYYCADINECEINNGGCSLVPMVTCMNTQGSRMCSACPPGYAGDGVSCVFRGICKINNGGCHHLAQCRDNPRISSTYVECVCPAGYAGTGVGPSGCTSSPADSNPCASNPCAHGTCSVNNITKEYTCSCNRKFTGRNCDIMKDPCASNPCQNMATCINLVGISFRCMCSEGFTGPLCENENEACGGALSGSTGMLKYPPEAYESLGHRISCSWTIETNSTKVLNITFSKFNVKSSTGCGSAWLQIHDGPDSASRLLGRFCGTDLPLGGNISTTSNIAYLWFIANAESARNEFNLTWNAVKPVCGGEIIASSQGTIQSPGSPGNYPLDRDCYWHLITPVDKRLEFHFFALSIGNNIGCDDDFIEFYSTSSSNSDTRFAKFCNNSSPMPFFSPNHGVTVHFHSDGKNAYPGFQLTYTVVEGLPGCGGIYTAEKDMIEVVSSKSDQECEYRIRQGYDAKTKITFLSLGLSQTPSCTLEYIEIREGPSKGALVGRYCGNVVPPPYVSNKPLTIASKLKSGSQWKIEYEKLCDVTFVNDTDSFTSPPPGLKKDCIYHIERPPGYIIELNLEITSYVSLFIQTCSFKYIEVRDGVDANAPLLKKLCLPGTKTLISTFNHLWIRYYRSDYVNLSFKATYTSTNTDCGGILKNTTGTIASPYTPIIYSSPKICSWVIMAPPEFVIRLFWLNFKFDGLGSVKIYDNNTDLGKGELIATYAGSTLPPVSLSTGNIMTIVFSITGNEDFLLSYIFIHESKVCGGVYYTSTGVIKSPNYPDDYPRSLDCIWKIIVPSGQQILLNVTSFDVEDRIKCDYDWLEIRQGITSHSPLTGKYCGTRIPKQVPSLTNQLYLRFRTDFMNSARGFKIIWSSAATGCGGTLTSASGSITSPGYPEPFDKRTECIWQITVASGSRIQILFIDIDIIATLSSSCHTRYNHDYVQIFDGLEVNSKSLGLFCFKKDNPVTSSGNNLVVKFTSSRYFRGRGFNLHYISLCNNTLYGNGGVIESPNFFRDSSQTLNCLWDIIVNNNNKINITFTHFDVGASTRHENKSCGSDYLELKFLDMDVYSYGTNFLTKGKYCGSENPEQITIDSDHAQVYMVSTRMEQGFRLEWQLFGCGGVLTDSSGTIQSPNYPNTFPGIIKCQWQIKVELGHRVELHFEKLEITRMGCYSIYIQVYDGPDNSTEVLSKFCYSLKPIVTISSGNQMFVEFVSTYNQDGKAFSANYSTVPTKCGGKFTTTEGTILSPNYPKNFNKNDSCDWLIELEKSHTIGLSFDDVDLPQNCSNYYIKVYDGPDETYPVLETICSIASNKTITSTSNQIFITFRAKGQSTSKGFLAKYKKSCGSRITTKESGNIQLTYREMEDYTTCTWTVISKDPARHIILIITRMQIPMYTCGDNSYAPLKLYSGDTNESPLIRTYCESEAPTPIVSDGSALTIELFRQMEFFATYSVLDSHCGGTFDLRRGFFATPGYPNSYPSDVQCEWTITVAPGNSVSLSFHEFDLVESEDCNVDYLEIRKHNVSGPLLGVYCGKNEPLNITHQGTVWMFFKSSKLESGMAMTAKGFYGEYELDEHNELSGPQGVITSPLYPQTYFGSTAFSWQITVEPKKRILLTFKEFSISYYNYGDCVFSKLEVYDGADATAPLLKSVCGVMLPDPIRSSTNLFYLTIYSHYREMDAKFLVEWLEVSEDFTTSASAATGKGCGSPEVVDISAMNGSYHLTSPGYPSGYKLGLNCKWIFSTISMNHISVIFEDLDLYAYSWRFGISCTFDVIAFYQKGPEDNDWQLNKTVCHRYDQHKEMQFTDLLQIKFTTNNFTNRTGFNATIFQKCGGSMSGPTGIIYINGTNNHEFNCEWIVSVRTAKTIRVTFEKMQIDHNGNSCNKYLMLRNGKYLDSPPLGDGKYCGTTIPEPLNTTGNTLYIKYNGSTNTTGGFVLKYQEISIKCGGEIILSPLDRSIEINSPNYPNTPYPYTECIWMIRAPHGESLRVDFEERFDLTHSTGCEIEYVELRDGGTESSPLIGRYCQKPSTQFSTDSVIFVKFFTNTKIPRNGFKAKVSLAFCGGTVRGYSGDIHGPSQHTKDPKHNCTWHIVGPYGHYLNIQFVELNIPLHSDNNIVILEKNVIFNNVTKLGQYNGTTLPPPLATLGNEAIVNFVATSGSTFRLKFTASVAECGDYFLKAESGVITSPGYPQIIQKAMCGWVIEVPEGRSITFNFVDLDLNPSKSKPIINGLKLYHGSDKTNVFLANVSAESSNRSYETSSNMMSIIYWSHDVSYYRGFKATFSSNKPTICSSGFNQDAGVITQPDSRNSSYWCRWTHYSKNQFLNETFVTAISLKTNSNLAVKDPQCMNALWTITVTNQDQKVLAKLCPNAIQNYLVRSPFPVTKVLAFTGIEMNFTISYKTYDCGGIIYKQEGYLSSPNYPNKSSQSAECAWLIRMNKEQTVNLTVLSMDLGNDCEKSFIAVYNGDGRSHPRIGKYCGTNKPDVIISQSDTLWIEYRHEAGAAGIGFQLKYEAESLGCGGIHHDRERFIHTPNYNRDYPNNAECIWEIIANPGYYIHLRFVERFQIEVSDKCTNDYVEIWNWQNDKWTSNAKECGRNNPNAVESTENRLKIVFRSNNKTTGSGFKAKWEWICGGTLEATDKPRSMMSPGYPISYGGNLNCVYKFVSKTDALIINFDDFELENGTTKCDNANVTIDAPVSIRWPPLDTYCGTKKPSILRVKQIATITFKTSVYGNYRGFKVTYNDDGCILNITQATIIKSPSMENLADHQRFFSPQISCAWRIFAPPKQVVVLRVMNLDIQCGVTVDVFKGLTDEKENKLASLCGKMTDLEPMFADAGTMLIKMYSSVNFYGGFTAEVYFAHGPAEGCGGTINLTETKQIQSPDLENLDCSWKIKAPRDYQIQVHFTELNLPVACTENTTSCSFIEIRDGLGPFAELIEKVDSNSNAKSEYRKFTTSLNRCYMTFVLVGRRSNAFKAVLTPVLSKCGRSILNATEKIQTLTSPNYPDKYPSNTICTWEIFPDKEWGKIELHFIDVNLTGGSDNLHICKGDRVIIEENPNKQFITKGLGPEAAYYNLNTNVIFMEYSTVAARHTFCGNLDSVFDYISSGRPVTVMFRSFLSAEQGTGFKLEYSRTGCNRNYTSLQGRLFSHRLQQSDCIITISVPKNRTISLFFNELLTPYSDNCSGAGFEVRDDGPHGKLLSHSCGSHNPNPIFSFSNRIYIHVYNSTFSEKYDVIYTSTDAGRGCGGELYNYKGRVSSPLYPNQFMNNTVCKWVVRVPIGLYTALKFSVFDIQGSCDQTYVRVTTYLNDIKLVRTFCQSDHPAILRSNSRIDIEYRSSVHNGGTGWLAMFQAVESETTEIR